MSAGTRAMVAACRANEGPALGRLSTRLPSGAPFELVLPKVWYSFYHDDGRVWLFDVTRATAIGQEQARERGGPEHIVVTDLVPDAESWLLRCRDLDRERALSMPFEELLTPVIAVLIEEAHLLIDGSHRVYRALVEGVPRLPITMIERPEDVAAVTVAKLAGEAAAWVREVDL